MSRKVGVIAGNVRGIWRSTSSETTYLEQNVFRSPLEGSAPAENVQL